MIDTYVFDPLMFPDKKRGESLLKIPSIVLLIPAALSLVACTALSPDPPAHPDPATKGRALALLANAPLKVRLRMRDAQWDQPPPQLTELTPEELLCDKLMAADPQTLTTTQENCEVKWCRGLLPDPQCAGVALRPTIRPLPPRPPFDPAPIRRIYVGN